MDHLNWRKSSRCGNTTCVEVAADQTAVYVRDSKNLGQAPLGFTYDDWSAFLENVAAGTYSE